MGVSKSHTHSGEVVGRLAARVERGIIGLGALALPSVISFIFHFLR